MPALGSLAGHLTGLFFETRSCTSAAVVQQYGEFGFERLIVDMSWTDPAKDQIRTGSDKCAMVVQPMSSSHTPSPCIRPNVQKWQLLSLAPTLPKVSNKSLICVEK